MHCNACCLVCCDRQQVFIVEKSDLLSMNSICKCGQDFSLERVSKGSMRLPPFSQVRWCKAITESFCFKCDQDFSLELRHCAIEHLRDKMQIMRAEQESKLKRVPNAILWRKKDLKETSIKPHCDTACSCSISWCG